MLVIKSINLFGLKLLNTQENLSEELLVPGSFLGILNALKKVFVALMLML